MNISRIRRVLFLLPITLVVGLISWFITDLGQIYEVTIKQIGFFGGGQLCPLPLYDAEGNSYEGFVWGHDAAGDYTGPAPLYYVEPSFYPIAQNNDPCWYPESLPPTIATQGIPIFPLQLNVRLINDRDRIRSGESTKLLAEAEFLDNFPENRSVSSVIATIPITASEQFDVYFNLRTTNFEFDPPNENQAKTILSLARKTNQSWIISPKKDTIGEQWFSVILYDDNGRSLAVADVITEVSHIGGFNPTFVAILSALGTFIIGLLQPRH